MRTQSEQRDSDRIVIESNSPVRGLQKRVHTHCAVLVCQFLLRIDLVVVNFLNHRFRKTDLAFCPHPLPKLEFVELDYDIGVKNHRFHTETPLARLYRLFAWPRSPRVRYILLKPHFGIFP